MQPQPCRTCQVELTRSATGQCWRCRPAPTVKCEGNALVIGGLGRLTSQQALTLAHRIADVLAGQAQSTDQPGAEWVVPR